GLGEETIELLYKQGLIHNYSDLYDLKYEDVVNLERMADKSALNLIQGISDSRNVPYQRVLFALGIRFVGETVAKKLAQKFKSIDELMAASFDALIGVDEIGERIAKSIIEFFSKESNRAIVEKFKQKGLQMVNTDKEKEVKSDKLS